MMDHLVTENSVTKSFPKQNIWFFVVYTKYKCHIFRILSNLFKAEQDSLRKSSAELLLKKSKYYPTGRLIIHDIILLFLFLMWGMRFELNVLICSYTF